MAKQYKIFYGILDWGLGHASRSIPIIRYLLKKGNEIHIGSSGRAFQLIRKEIHPDKNIQLFNLPEYNPEYTGKKGLLGDMLKQAPGFLKTIEAERKWMRLQNHKEKYDLIISDNRFGLYDKDCKKNIFMSHQATILTPGKFGLLQFFTNKWYQNKYLKNFDELWIPDSKDKFNISGKLSLGKLPLKKRYIGPISRFYDNKTKAKRYKYDLLLLLSGPEPQRTYLEDLLINQVKEKSLNTLCVQGKTELYDKGPITDNISRVSYLNGDELKDAILHSKHIICRSGYSTIMDLVALNRNAILIPTPGQTEQEYLAKCLKEKKWFYSNSQKKFNLEQALEASEQYSIDSEIPVNYFYRKIGSIFKDL